MDYVLYDITEYNLSCLRDMPLEEALKKLNVIDNSGCFSYYRLKHTLGSYLDVSKYIKTAKSKIVRDIEMSLKGYALVEMDYSNNYIKKLESKNDMFDIPIDFKMIRKWKKCCVKQIETFEDKDSALLFIEVINEAEGEDL